MKKIFLLLTFITVNGMATRAQAPFNTVDSVNINKLNAKSLVHGDMWRNTAGAGGKGVEFPQGSNKYLAFVGGL